MDLTKLPEKQDERRLGLGGDRSRETRQEVAAKSEETVYLPQFKKKKKKK